MLIDTLDTDFHIILDIGANRGQTASKYRSIFPSAYIHCFEPSPDAYKILSNNVSKDPKISVYQLGISDTSGRRKFFVNNFDDTNSLLPRPKSSRRYYPSFAGPKTEIDIDVTSIDQFLKLSGIQQVHIIKLDIQGGELMALHGAEQLLQRGDVPIIYTEIMFVPHYEDCALFFELCRYLSNFSYTLYDVYNLKRAGNGQLRYGDAIFVSDELRKEAIDTGAEEP